MGIPIKYILFIILNIFKYIKSKYFTFILNDKVVCV